MSAKPTRQIERLLESFAHELVIAVLNFELHAQTSQYVQDNYRQMNTHLAQLFEIRHEPLRLTFTEHHIQFEGHALLGASLQAARLLRLTADRHIEAIVLSPQISADELARFVELLCTELDVEAFLSENLPNALSRIGIDRVEVVLRSCTAQTEVAVDDDPLTQSQALLDYQNIADVLQDSHTAAFRGEELELSRATGVVEQAVMHMSQEASNLLALATYDDIDSFTVGHSVRVALLALQVARAGGASHEMQLRVGTAAMLHDIGKSRVPQEILFKQGHLTEEEWGFMAQHPRMGAEILLEQNEIDSAAVSAAFCHHLSPAGGYPSAALPFQPSGISKLVRVCDVFEALTAIRPYKKAMTPIEAFVVMHRQPGDFDQHWLRFFVQTIGIFPLGSRVRLDTGEEAIVTENGRNAHQPIVRLVQDSDSGPSKPRLITIGTSYEGTQSRITAVIARQTELRDKDETELTEATEHRCC